MWTRALDLADASCGGKAHHLARLIAAGLPVPDGFVLDDRAFRAATGDRVREAEQRGGADRGSILVPDPGSSLRLRPDVIGHTLEELARRVVDSELPADLVDEVNARARSLGGPFAVRSSASIEDGEAGAAAGVFSSRTAVAYDNLWSAIRAVWTSALTPLAAAYARHRRGTTSIAVIVQRYVEGEPVVVYTRAPGEPDGTELLVQRHGAITKLARAGVDTIGGVAVAAERAIGVVHGADVELVVSHAGVAIVQARPIVHPALPRRVAPPPPVLSTLHDGRRWTLDVAHNPDPLSTAQADLVERVERAGAAPWSARVCAGYLYTTPRVASTVEPPATAAELRSRATAIERRLEEALGDTAKPVGLAVALDRYLAFFRIWAHELGPLIAASRAGVEVPTSRPMAAVDSLLLRAVEGQAIDVESMLGRLAPAWDVAVPTFHERPGLIDDALARARQVLAERRVAPVTTDAFAAIAAEYAEIDDHYFARAQWLVRSAILARADELGIAREDAFWIPIDELLADADLVDVQRRASGARAAATRAAGWNMPIVVGDPDSPTGDRGVALRGIGSGHQITGRVRRFESLASAIVVNRGDIVVTRAVTPALAVIVIGCAAIISETGGLLDHGAAMARELGIPCVVGCRDAWTQLADGMIVSIDNDLVAITR